MHTKTKAEKPALLLAYQSAGNWRTNKFKKTLNSKCSFRTGAAKQKWNVAHGKSSNNIYYQSLLPCLFAKTWQQQQWRKEADINKGFAYIICLVSLLVFKEKYGINLLLFNFKDLLYVWHSRLAVYLCLQPICIYSM
jgi:hypothetical protein